MIAASSRGRDHIGQWLVGRSTQVRLRSSARPPSHASPPRPRPCTCSDVKPVQMTVLGMSRRASLVSSAASRSDAARLGDRPLPNVSSCSSAEPVEVLLRRELAPARARLLDVVEAGVERALRRARSRRRPWPRSARGRGRSRHSRRTRCRCARRARPERRAALTASQIASTWSASVIAERSASADSRPGSVSAVTSWPSARSAAATSSHAHAPSQNPGTRTIGAVVIPRPYRLSVEPRGSKEATAWRRRSRWRESNPRN